jgi:hypothetical protein
MLFRTLCAGLSEALVLINTSARHTCSGSRIESLLARLAAEVWANEKRSDEKAN